MQAISLWLQVAQSRFHKQTNVYINTYNFTYILAYTFVLDPKEGIIQTLGALGLAVSIEDC